MLTSLSWVGIVAGAGDRQAPLTSPDLKPAEREKLRAACPDYKHYSTYPQCVAGLN